MLQKLSFIPSIAGLRRIASLGKPQLDMVYRSEDLHPNYYAQVCRTDDRELEHQIGRLLNYKSIISEINSAQLPGDVVEFGTWRGFSLQWIAYFLEREAVFDKKIIGLDSFDGLPNTEGVFMKGAFSDTSEAYCRSVLTNSKHLYAITKQNISIEKFSFSDTTPLMQRIRQITTKKFCFVHIDCDISSSLNDIFTLLVKHQLLADTCYLLFDDYGCMESYQKTVEGLMEELGQTFDVKEHSKTKLTKNFLIKKR